MACLEGACTGQAHLPAWVPRPLPELPGGQGGLRSLAGLPRRAAAASCVDSSLALEKLRASLRLSRGSRPRSLRRSSPATAAWTGSSAGGMQERAASPWSAGLRLGQEGGTGWVRHVCSSRAGSSSSEV